jgi:DNA-binding MarR family transcriptional regulator
MGKKAKSKDKSKGKGRKKDRKKAALAELEVQSHATTVVQEVTAVDEVPLSDGSRRAIDPTELAARLASLSTVLQRSLARTEAHDGLTRARLSALALLVLGGPRTLGDLAAAERVRPPTMTRLVHAMEADGLVAREPNPADGRSIIIRATPKGEQQLDRGRSRQIAPLAESISDLDRIDRLLLEDSSDLLGRLLRDASWESSEPSE